MEKKVVNKKQEKIWLIAYINRTFIDIIEREIIEYGFDVEVYVPTVKVLRKTFKGQRLFEFVPMLFNYGFFKVNYKDACSAEYLNLLRNRITAIYGWVKDPAYTMLQEDQDLKLKKEGFINAKPQAAIATDKEVVRMVKQSKELSIFSAEDIGRLNVGDYIKLEGYPFDNMPAEILHINTKKKEVKVRLLMDTIVKDVLVSFDNVFYSIYKNYNEAGNHISTDELSSKYGENALDNIILNKTY